MQMIYIYIYEWCFECGVGGVAKQIAPVIKKQMLNSPPLKKRKKEEKIFHLTSHGSENRSW